MSQTASYFTSDVPRLGLEGEVATGYEELHEGMLHLYFSRRL
jgi:hypothetical protein